MPYATITKTFRFEAAHQLVHHDGKCARPHGHSYRVEVVLRGRINDRQGAPDEGMVRDFGHVSYVWKNHLEHHLDHQDLNLTIGEDIDLGTSKEWRVPACWPTTAENIAAWILRMFQAFIPETCAVRVWETATSHAIVTIDDLNDDF